MRLILCKVSEVQGWYERELDFGNGIGDGGQGIGDKKTRADRSTHHPVRSG